MTEEQLPPAGVFDWQRPIETAITTFRPRSNVTGWKNIAEVVQTIARACSPRDEAKARQILSEVTKLATFAKEEKYKLTPISGWMTPEFIERFVEKEFGELVPSSQAAHRRLLRQIHTAFHGLGQADRPAGFADIWSFKPYDNHELAALWALPRGQRTKRRTVDLKTLLALGLGCGLSPVEVAWAKAEDILRAPDGQGPVTMVVRGKGARLVTCRRRWEDYLWEQAQHLYSGPAYLFQHGRQAKLEWRTTSVVTEFLKGLKPALETPEVVMSRLRATWLMELVHERTHTATILAAAGPEATMLLERLKPHLRSPDGAAQALRGS